MGLVSSTCGLLASSPTGTTGFRGGTRQYVTVTQHVCNVFGGPEDRRVERLRLRKAAEKHITSANDPLGNGNLILGLQVERITNLPSNQVEAVFSYSALPSR